VEGTGATSETFSGAIQKVDLRPYIDELEVEVARLSKARPKNESEWEIELARLQALLRDQSRRLANQLGMAGDPVILFMLMSGVISVAWAAFAVRRTSVDPNRPFEQRLNMVELLDALGNGLSSVIESVSAYADVYKK